MDTRTGEIRELTAGEPLRATEVEVSEREATALARLKATERMAALSFYRRPEPQARTEQKPTTKAARTSGMPNRSKGDNPSRGKKKGRRG